MTNVETTFFNAAFASGVAMLIGAAVLDILHRIRRRRIEWMIQRVTLQRPAGRPAGRQGER